MKKITLILQLRKNLVIGLFGLGGATLRFALSLILSSFLTITICNLLGIVILAKSFSYKRLNNDYFQVGLLGGFTSVAALIVLNFGTVIFLINIFLGYILYKIIKK